MNMKLSIIVPVYNAEKYLEETVCSILNQTFTDFELILIDDGSTDQSLDVCTQLQNIDERIVVIHQENQGIGEARNIGLKIAQGEYIGFADSDDLLHPQMYEILLNKADEVDGDLIIAEAKKVYKKSEIKLEKIEHIPTTYLTIEELYEKMYGNSDSDWMYMVVWNKLYRRELLEGIKFAKEKGTEDTVFNSKIFHRLKRGYFVKVPLYFWIQRDSSESHQNFSERNYNVLKEYFEMNKYLRKYVPTAQKYALIKLYKVLFYTLENSRKTYWYKEIKCLIYEEMKMVQKEFVCQKKISFVKKIVFLMFYYVPLSYTIFRKMLEWKAYVQFENGKRGECKQNGKI